MSRGESVRVWESGEVKIEMFKYMGLIEDGYEVIKTLQGIESSISYERRQPEAEKIFNSLVEQEGGATSDPYGGFEGP